MPRVENHAGGVEPDARGVPPMRRDPLPSIAENEPLDVLSVTADEPEVFVNPIVRIEKGEEDRVCFEQNANGHWRMRFSENGPLVYDGHDRSPVSSALKSVQVTAPEDWDGESALDGYQILVHTDEKSFVLEGFCIEDFRNFCRVMKDVDTTTLRMDRRI